MPTTNVGIYEVVLEQTYAAQPVLNVFHYLSTVLDDDEQLLCATAFDEDVQAAIATIQNNTLLYTNIRCANLTGNLADASVIPTVPDGDVLGDEMASFVSCPFRYDRETKDTRNGSKRFAAMTEQNINGGAFEVAFFADMQALALVLAANISTVGGIFEPIILSKPPDGAGVWTYNTIGSVTAINRVTTQNSRKPF